jgi:hypothetical protein
MRIGSHSKGRHQVAAIIACTLVLSGCVTAPSTYTFNKSRTYPESKEEIWQRAVEFFATNNLSIKTIEKDSGIIAAERMIGAPSSGGTILDMASCGVGALEVPVAQTLDLNLFVKTTSSGTNVTVNTRFSESRHFGNDPPHTVECNSTGTLEQKILNYLGSPH